MGSPVSALAFTKMQGLGNDFVVVDATTRPFDLSPAQIRMLADRRFGVGCDQVLVVEAPSSAGVDFRYRIFNADGGEVEQCGNGARCFVVFVRARGLTDRREIRVETRSGVIVPRLEDDGQVTVDMGVPRFAPETVPFLGGTGAPVERLDVDGTILEVSVLSMGNPHAVQIVADVDAAPVRRWSGSTSTARSSRSRCCRWAIRTRCRSSRTSTRHRWRPKGRASKATRASRAASTRATCRSSIAITFGCASGSEAQARRSRVVRERALRSSRGAGEAASTLA